MNVYLIPSSYGGCSYVRMLLPSYHNGFNIDDYSKLMEARKDPSEVKARLMGADVVVFHRPENKYYYNLAKMLKKNGKKIVMDNDDTFKIDDHHPLGTFEPDGTEVLLKDRDNCVTEFMKLADLVTTTTETLANEYRLTNKNTVVLPNCVDPFDWDEPLRNETDIVRIGIVGSAAFEYDYLHIKDLIRKLDKRKDVQMLMFGLGSKEHRKANKRVTEAFQDDYDFWDTINIEHFPWCPMEEYQTKLNEMKLDIMLIPRRDNYFNTCKSNVKFLEASMCEIPVIAQSFPNAPYEEIKHMKNGILIEDNADWEEYVDLLIGDKNLRRFIGKNAKEYTLENYNIEDKAHLWADAYEKLYAN